MNFKIIKNFSQNFKNYNIKQIEGGASKRNFYKLYNQNNSYIVTDFNNDKSEYFNYIKIYNILETINIAVPKIIERNDNDLIIISENFGELRFDKIIDKYPLKDLLNYAIETLVILKNSIKFNSDFQLPQYNFEIFKNEIMELPQYYFPYININDIDLIKEFSDIWKDAYKDIEFKFNSFAHKDFNINNLLLLPSKKNHLKCGVIDFQDAFWGESSWDLFSLLEDSRILFSDEHNNNLIEYYYVNTNINISFEQFIYKYYFLNSSRQTRLLGRWIKLSKELNKKMYLDFIPITMYRLQKSINYSKNKNLIKFYTKYIFNQ